MSENNDALLQNMYESILELHSKMDVLTSTVNNLSKKQKDIEKSTAKMSTHIDFVENTYSSLKSPLQFVKDKVSLITGIQKSNLPSITDKKENNEDLK